MGTQVIRHKGFVNIHLSNWTNVNIGDTVKYTFDDITHSKIIDEKIVKDEYFTHNYEGKYIDSPLKCHK